MSHRCRNEEGSAAAMSEEGTAAMSDVEEEGRAMSDDEAKGAGELSSYGPGDFAEVWPNGRAELLREKWWKGQILLANAMQIQSPDWWEQHDVAMAVCACAGACESCADGWFEYPPNARVMQVPPTKRDLTICARRLTKAAPFIVAMLAAGKSVAFHCKAGKDRSPLAMHMFLCMLAHTADNGILDPQDERAWQCIVAKRRLMQHAPRARRPGHADMRELRVKFIESHLQNCRESVPKWFMDEDATGTDEEGYSGEAWHSAKLIAQAANDGTLNQDTFDTLMPWPQLERGLDANE